MERLDARTIVLREKIYKELKVTFQGIEQQIKNLEDKKTEILMKCEMYEECLDKHLLSSGSDIIKEHLSQARLELANTDIEIEKLKLEKDAYRIEISVQEEQMRQ